MMDTNSIFFHLNTEITIAVSGAKNFGEYIGMLIVEVAIACFFWYFIFKIWDKIKHRKHRKHKNK